MVKNYFVFLLFLFTVSFGYGQVLSNDCSVLTGTWTFNSVTQNGGYWLLDNNTDFVISEPFGAYDNLVLTSNLRSFNTGTAPECTIEISDDGGATWTAGSITFPNLPNNYLNYNYNIGTLAGTNNRIRWRRTGGTRGLRINTITLTGTAVGAGSNDSDIIAVTASEAVSIPSNVNDTAPLLVGEGVQVWQITVRDGGASAPDADNLSTILTDLTFAQASGNQVTTWTDAIESIAIFDGATRLATGNVISNQIQFTGMNLDVPDDTQTTLSVRLSLQCPLGPDAFDNEDFVFSLSNANTTFSPSGSGKASFPFITTANGENRIDISATELEFTVQPTTTGVNSPMTNVVVSLLDDCGNLDTDFAGVVNLTSTGTMTGVPLTATVISGQATFTNVIHTVVETARTLTATATGVTNAISDSFDITNTTTLQPGDLAILAVNTDYDSSGSISGDRISFVIFKDITVNTEIYLTDNGYERRYTDRWGSSEGVIRIRRTGSTLPAGSVITIEANNLGNITDGSHFDVYTCGIIDNNWDKWALSGAGIGGFNMNNDDDIWFMQGGTWTNSANIGSGTTCAGIATDTWHNSTYNGNVLYGWTESGWDTAAGGCSGNTQWSTLYPRLDCYNTIAPLSSGKVKFDDPNNPDFSLTTNGRIDWIALINDSANWNTYATNADYDNIVIDSNYDYKLNTTCSPIIVGATAYVNGKWTGRADTNWFYCANWDTFAVPDQNVDVLIEDHPTFTNHANIDATAPFADDYGNVATARNLTITGERVEISGSINNVLEIYGDLLIPNSGTGVLDMNDGNPVTADGSLYIRGNWVNTRGPVAFNAGNGTVTFNGTTIQSITYGGPPTPPLPSESEIFYNVILDNDFDIAFGDRSLYMDGDLTINAGRSLNVQSNQFVHVGNVVDNQGDFTLEDSASLIQVQDVTNIGNLTMSRIAYVTQLDYVYWSSPVTNFNTSALFNTTSPYIFRWDSTIDNTAFGGTGQGNWVGASNTLMEEGVGYIARTTIASAAAAPDATIFQNGVPNNGNVQFTLRRGTDNDGLDGDDNDDDWNLIGNPYPSAISADAFLLENAITNPTIEGYLDIWTHGTAPSAIQDPFYENNGGLNYDSNDYVRYNRLGSTVQCGPEGVDPSNNPLGYTCFDGDIAAGQGFMVNMVNGGAINQSTTLFTNAMRSRIYDNSAFFRSSAGSVTDNSSETAEEKHRIWLYLGSENHGANRILVGYATNATMAKDVLYDAIVSNNGINQNFYSIINDEPFNIQGRALPFTDTDVIRLGFNSVSEDNYTIGITGVDGLFETGQTIYLKDNVLQFVHNLSLNPYTFTSEIGEFNERFEIVFRADALSIDDHLVDSNALTIVELANGEVEFKIGQNLEIHKVEILDLVGRQVYLLKGNSATERYDLSQLSKAAYVAKVTLSNGQVISKKAIKQH